MLSTGAPTVAGDLYCEQALIDSSSLFARIRDAGAVAWMPANRLHAIGRSHLAWGNGLHACVGIHVAKIVQTLLRAMVPRVETISAGSPEPIRNNRLQGIARLRASVA